MPSGIVALPGGKIERRPAGIQVEIPPDDVRDGFCLDLTFRPLGRVVDVGMEQRRARTRG